jgi:hypothetical protein
METKIWKGILTTDGRRYERARRHLPASMMNRRPRRERRAEQGVEHRDDRIMSNRERGWIATKRHEDAQKTRRQKSEIQTGGLIWSLYRTFWKVGRKLYQTKK